MWRLRAYIKKYWFLFLLALACIFGQAYTELTLPDYMSDIVSSGIQAGGFDNAISPILTKDTYEHLLLFSSGDDEALIKASYVKTKGEDVSDDIKSVFTKVEDQDVYLLKDDCDTDALNTALVKPMLIQYSISTIDKDSDQYKKINKELAKAVNKAEKQYNKGLKAYNKGYKAYKKGKKQYDQGLKAYKKGLSQYKKGLSQYHQGLAQYNKGISQYKKGKRQYKKGMKAYKKGKKQYNKGYARYKQGLSGYKQGLAQYKQLVAMTGETAQTKQMKTKLDQAKKQLDKTKRQFVTAKKQLNNMKNLLKRTKVQLSQGKKKLDQAKATFPKAKRQLDLAKSKLDQAKNQFPKAKKELKKADKKLKKAKKKLDNAKKKIETLKKKVKAGDLYYFLEEMDEDQLKEMFTNIDEQMDTMGTSTMGIAAGQAVKYEYELLGADTNKVQNDYILMAGIRMLVIALMGAIASIAAAYLASKVGAGVARDLRSAVFHKVESFSNEEMNRFSTASLITRSTNDITQIQMVVVMFIRMVCYAPVLGIGGLLKAIKNSPSMTWIIGSTLVLLFVILMITFAIALPKFKIVQSLIDKLNLSMRENLSGILVIRAFGNEEESVRRFDESNTNLTKVNLFVNRIMISLMPIMMYIMNVLTLIIVYYGAKQVDLGNIAIGQMMAFLQYGMMIIMGFLMVALIAIILPRASISAGRVADVLETVPAITDPLEPVDFLGSHKGYVEFNDVTFTYPGASEPVLNDISFIAEPGKTTAIIGSTGSGKSTLINLIPRFYEVTEGEVKVDGVNVKDVRMHDLRERIGLVPQKGLLFSGTIKSNLTYGAKEATDEELEEVIRVSQAKEFIDTMPEHLDTAIAQGGTNVSGGQKQRLAIARALAKKPEILIFDDSFSALDFKTDAKLRKELAKLCDKYHHTLLIVGQRIASIMDADQIIVLDEGRIVGKGTHQELLKDCQVYQEIAYSQLSKEELSYE